MPIIIDGYNLLCSCGFVGDRIGPGSLERARGLFLGWLVNVLSQQERQKTTVVFDSVLRIPELPDQYRHQDIEVCFATGHQDADEMIIERIQSMGSPGVLVVSSDHQIQSAAKSYKCKYEDSDHWFERLVAEKANDDAVQKSSQELKTELTLKKKTGDESINASEAEKWLAQFLPGANQATSPSNVAPAGSNSNTPNTSVQPPNQPSAVQPRQTSTVAKQKPIAKPKSESKFASTSFDALSKMPRPKDHLAAQESKDQKAASAKGNRQPNPSNTGNSAERSSDDIDETQPIKKVDLSSIELEPDSMPDLNLGASMANSELANSTLMPDDLDQWLDDFDTQFEDAKMDLPVDSKGKPGTGSKGNVDRSKADSVNRPTAKPSSRQTTTRSSSAAGTPEADESPRLTMGQSQPHKVQGSPQGRQKTKSTPAQQSSQPTPIQEPPDHGKTASANKRPIDGIDGQQMERWNRQLKETDAEIFPPGYAEDILFAETFETDERLKRKRRK